ncbi:class I SAM-dependent methyltransferase [Streptomyces rhizosphaericus]|uniref:class I SAM-dependent methyltransferase n=1 Tax=Streptomyces rhizosphaericus TaxID=114699 RepID=UPI0031DFC786
MARSPITGPSGFNYSHFPPEASDRRSQAEYLIDKILHGTPDGRVDPAISENLRHHYAMTLRDWNANLVEHWDEAVAEVGLGTARVWGLYMASSRIAFERNEIQLHQVLGVRTTDDGADGLPLRPTW